MVHYLMRKWFPNKFSTNACNAFLEFSSHTQALIEGKKKITREVGIEAFISSKPFKHKQLYIFYFMDKNLKCVVCQESMKIMGNQCMTTSLFSS